MRVEYCKPKQVVAPIIVCFPEQVNTASSPWEAANTFFSIPTKKEDERQFTLI